MTDFGRIPQYASYIAQDPFRHGLQFPAVVNELGGLLKKRILDVDTGDGLSPRLIAREGVSLVMTRQSKKSQKRRRTKTRKNWM
jgi:hypothetical protein